MCTQLYKTIVLYIATYFNNNKEIIHIVKGYRHPSHNTIFLLHFDITTPMAAFMRDANTIKTDEYSQFEQTV